RHEDAIGIAHSLRLAHTVGVNGFFTTLIALSRRPGARARLTAWWSELRCGRLFGDMVRPDAYGRWREDGQQIEFFLEFDFGTEDLATLGKIFGAEVEFEEELDLLSVLAPSAVGVGSNHVAEQPAAAQLGPPRGQPRAGAGAPAERDQGGEEAVDPDGVGQAQRVRDPDRVFVP